MSLFQNSTLPGLRVYTPSSYAIDAAPANAEIGHSFARAYEASARRTQDQKQFDSTQEQRKKEFEERKRQFDIEHPPMPGSGPEAGSAPAGSLDPSAVAGTDTPAEPSGWMGGQTQSGWQNVAPTQAQDPYRTTARELPAKIAGSHTVEEASKWMAANPDAVSAWNKWEAATGRSVLKPAFQFPVQTEAKILEAKRVENNSIAAKSAVADVAAFNKRALEIDPESRSAIKTLQPNQDGSISPAQWQALGLAEERTKLQKENAARTAELEAMQRGDQQRTTISDKGVTRTFSPPPPASVAVTPTEMTLSGGERIAYNPKTGAFKILAQDKKEKEMSFGQLQSLAKTMDTAGDTNNATAISSFLAGKALSQIGNKTATAPAVATPAAPAEGKKRNEVPRVINGRTAIFDADTKEFLRYQ